MHYEAGGEVAKQLVSEVTHLAFNNDNLWARTNDDSADETFICHTNGMIALKLHAYFDCSPEELFLIISKRQSEWDLHCRGIELLEKYDNNNDIQLLTCQMPMASGVFHICVYRCLIKDDAGYSIVYQSVHHERIPCDVPLITVYPSAYFIHKVKDSPRQCQVTSILQFPSEFNDNPKVISSLASSSGRIIAGLRGVVNRLNDEGDKWDTFTNDLRKKLYRTMHDLELVSYGWILKYSQKGYKTFIDPTGTRIVSQGVFALPYATHALAVAMLRAVHAPAKWDHFAHVAEDPVYVRPNAFVQKIRYCDIQDGSETQGYVACAINGVRNNTCDLVYRISYHEPPASDLGEMYGHMPSGGMIIMPDQKNPGHSIIRAVIETNYNKPVPPDGINRAAARIYYCFNAFFQLVTSILSQQEMTSLNLVPKLPSLGFPSGLPYVKEVNELLTKVFTPSYATDFEAPEIKREYIPKFKPKRKCLVSVDHVVPTNPKDKETKPILFLVTNGDEAERTFRRRIESPLSCSHFENLPQEIILEIFNFLDSPALASIARTCTHLHELITNCQLWKTLFSRMFGTVRGRVARRYAGDDDQTTFFESFQNWKDLYLERQYIEAAWRSPERRALSFRVTKAHSGEVRSMALLPSRHRLVTGSKDRLVRVWDVTSGACLQEIRGPATCVAIEGEGENNSSNNNNNNNNNNNDNNSNERVKVGFKNGAVREYDVARGECVSEVQLGDSMRGCIFYDSRTITWQDHATCWDLNTSQSIGNFSGHLKVIKQCTLSRSHSILFTASRDTTVKLWDVHNQIKIANVQGHTRAVNCVELLGPNQCMTGSSDKVVKLWDIRKLSSPIHSLSLHTGKVRCIKYNEIGEKICTGGEDGIHLWDSKTLRFIRSDFKGENVGSIALDEESIAYGGFLGQIQYYDFTPHR